MTILVVDDNVINISLIRISLAKLGYTVFTARDGVEATSILKSESIDVVMTDWMMPNLDGIGLIRWVRATMDPLPALIVITALGSQEAQDQAIQAGADAYLVKPLNPLRLDELFKEIARKKKMPLLPESYSHVPSAVLDEHAGPKFFGIGIVAGTGGANGIRTIFTHLEPLNETAWFIVLHGPGWAAEALAEQMRSYTRHTVVIPKDGDPVQPNTVYIAPGDHHMLVAPKHAVIQLTTSPPENFLRPSADPLFVSLARVFGKRAVAIMLGGTGADGSIGCGHIKVGHGQVLVQAPADTVSSQMPQHAISLGLVSHVLPLDKIAAGVMDCVRKTTTDSQQHVSSTTRGYAG
jgi:two-component system, chemotaxis family, protein-glutamate methylesterase/glutaminase